MITFALCITMGKSQGWGHSQNALRDLLGITGIQSIVLSGLWMVLAGLLWMVGKCLHQCHVDSQFSSFLSMFCSTLPSFLPPLPQDVASNISILALLLLYTYIHTVMSKLYPFSIL
jgi:hypothetical protein